MDYSGLTGYFNAIRGAFDHRSIRRGIVVAEGDFIACQTWIEGRIVREFTHSPAGSLPPSGQRVAWVLLTSSDLTIRVDSSMSRFEPITGVFCDSLALKERSSLERLRSPIIQRDITPHKRDRTRGDPNTARIGPWGLLSDDQP
jgi:hypothetical protein